METTKQVTDREELEAILLALRSNPIPLKHQKRRTLPGGGGKMFAPWRAFVHHFNTHAGDRWEFIPSPASAGQAWYAERDEKKNITGYTKIPTTSVSGCIRITVGSESISRGSVGTAKATETGKGLPEDSAKWICFRQAAELFGVKLEEDGSSNHGRRQDRSNGQDRRPRNDHSKASPKKEEASAHSANALITAAESAGVSTGDLLRTSKEMFSKSISALDSDQVIQLAARLEIAL